MEPTIQRIKDRTGNFTIVANDIFKRDDVSARAKGIYIYILTLPDDWKIYKSELYRHFSEGRQAIDTAFRELELLGYIVKERNRVQGGKFSGWNYNVYESPTHQKTESRETDHSENRKSGNQHVLSTDLPITEEQVTDKEESQETETMKTSKVLASLLLEKCREVDKKYCLGKEERTINGWATDIDKLIRLDKRTESEVRDVIVWSKNDDFWSPNIMSGKKLRMKFPMLFAQMSKSKAQAERKRPRTREEIRAEMIARYGDK